jgi:hypothetical protein
MSNTPTELPEDIKKEINETSEAYANKRYKFSHYPNEWMAVNNAHHAGATAYAPHKVEAEKAKKLLEAVIALWDSGLLPNTYAKVQLDLQNEIKMFLQSK